MARTPTRAWYFVVPAVCALILSCRNTQTARPYVAPPPSGLDPTIITYAEEDAFDALFESLLVNQTPVILIQTDATAPTWGPRLNAWIAAWNRGGKVAEEPRTKARGQVPVTVNGETIREFRLLIDDLMKQVDDLARRGSWTLAEERTQRRRVALLKPYSLRFHLNSEKRIQLIFFNGMYAQYYRQFMNTMPVDDSDEPSEWSRELKCSGCLGDKMHARLDNPQDERPSPQTVRRQPGNYRGVARE